MLNDARCSHWHTFSFTVSIGILFTASAVWSQTATPRSCASGSSGPVAGSSAPFAGGMCDLGSLLGAGQGFSFGEAISADGSAIVGLAQTDLVGEAFIWRADSPGMARLGLLDSSADLFSFATAVSADGMVVVGQSGDLLALRAFRWKQGDADLQPLGSLRSDNSGDSFPAAVSADGAVIVGFAATDDGFDRAFRWDDGAGSMQDLGSLRTDNSGNSEATAVSRDGRVVVGNADTLDGFERAFRWVDGAGSMQDLGSLRADNSGNSEATAVSRDGRVVVGNADTLDGFERAFRWVDGAGSMQDLGSLRADNSGNSEAVAVSDDGRVVVGDAATEDGATRAFRWIADTGTMQDLGSLKADGSGNSSARGVSADGTVVVGEADTDDGNLRAFIWRTRIQDLGNVMASFGELADDTAAAIAVQQDRIGHLADLSCTTTVGGRCLTGTLAWDSNGAGRSLGGSSASGYAGLLSSGYGALDGVTVGFTLGAGSSGAVGTVDAGTLYGGAIWAVLNSGGESRAGFGAKIALAYGQASERMTRGRDQDNVIVARGDSDLATRTASAQISYGIDTPIGWLITPSVTLTHHSSRRDGYSESGSDTNARYSSLTVERTSLSAALTGEFDVTATNRLRLAFGLDHDLQTDTVTLDGISNVPGMESFSISTLEGRRKTRSFLETGLTHDIMSHSFVSGNLRVGQPEFGNDLSVRLSVSYGLRF